MARMQYSYWGLFEERDGSSPANYHILSTTVLMLFLATMVYPAFSLVWFMYEYSSGEAISIHTMHISGNIGGNWIWRFDSRGLNCQIKFRIISIWQSWPARMGSTPNLNATNIFECPVWSQIAGFNACQYFNLYSNYTVIMSSIRYAYGNCSDTVVITILPITFRWCWEYPCMVNV